MNSTDGSGGPVCGECGTSHDYGDCGLATTDSVGHEIVIEACPNCHTVYPVPPAMDHGEYEELIYE
jgi:hypothetical protein